MAAWENIDLIFPTGLIPTDEGYITTKEAKHRDFEVIKLYHTEQVRNMTTRRTGYIYTKDGEFATGDDYNVYTPVRHPDPEILPLNVFGQTMVNNYLFFHDVEI